MRALLLLGLLSAAACEPTNAKGLQRGQSASVIAVGARHVCARVADRTLRCFGDNSAGQLGDGKVATEEAGTETGTISGPQIVPGLTAVADVTAGGAHTCARTDDGTVRCWGANDFGQLGDATTVARPTPIILTAMRGARALSAGGAHTCAISGDKTVACWGRNDDGQLGDGSTTMRPTPVSVAGLNDVEELAAGTFHTCARLADKTVRCWGRNDAGQIGDGTIGTPRRIPTKVIGLAGPVAGITVGLADSCVLLEDRTVACWGRGNARASATSVIGFVSVAELAMGASPSELHLCARLQDQSIRCTTTLGTTPRLIPGIVNAADIAVGAEQACARLTDGALRCWTPNKEPIPIVL
jgi:alpha-tubulin suppressor-like RCC1 family protein